ncbi:SDR family oxidoreductase [Kribbella sp. NPDC050281]|uniref:SDR family NAD(P)-dependent oxidoreductase n=1 Tax=Kribbella sp. NPDC050281 TaxID=3155515 RepID=UPI0033ECAD2D
MQKVALVTGSASGIGAATARRLADDGMVVAVHSRSSVEAGVALATDLGGSYHQADLSSDAEAAGLVPSVLAEHRRLDVLVNNAGISWPVPHAELEGLSAADWRRLLDVNLIAPWLLCTAALPALRESGGCVVNVTSHAGVRPKGSSIAYAASKAALNHVTKLLAAALGPVRVNAVAPGLVDTPLTASWTEAQELWKTSSPMRRAAQPSDVADLISSLVHNSYITGEVVLLDGGLNLR